MKIEVTKPERTMIVVALLSHSHSRDPLCTPKDRHALIALAGKVGHAPETTDDGPEVAILSTDQDGSLVWRP